jgi:Tol biopolymer transport system component
MKRSWFIPIGILVCIFLATIVVILYGKGYKLGFDKGKLGISGTGMLVATSEPDGAQVFVNGHLTTATNNTINLAPGEYDVKIFKEGYFSWEKKLAIKTEVVTKADALLLPTAPKLENITKYGVSNPVIDPTLSRIAYTSASQSIKKNGIYVLDMSIKPIITLQGASTQITDDTVASFSTAALKWSPDAKQLAASVSAQGYVSTYLVDAGGFNSTPSDITATLDGVNTQWQDLKKEKEKARIDGLKKELKKVVSEDFNILSWSPDESRILYEASVSASLPIIIKPRIIGVDSTPEQRDLEKGVIYVYDTKEDKNFQILKVNEDEDIGSIPLTWFPDSKHLIYTHNKKIDIMEYDGANNTTVYAGPFVDSFVFPWSDTSRIVILTNLGNPDISPNLYTISLK